MRRTPEDAGKVFQGLATAAPSQVALCLAAPCGSARRQFIRGAPGTLPSAQSTPSAAINHVFGRTRLKGVQRDLYPAFRTLV